MKPVKVTCYTPSVTAFLDNNLSIQTENHLWNRYRKMLILEEGSQTFHQFCLPSQFCSPPLFGLRQPEPLADTPGDPADTEFGVDNRFDNVPVLSENSSR